MIRVGVIGLGFMGRMHVSAYAQLPDVSVVAIADQDAARLQGARAAWGNIAGAAHRVELDGAMRTTDAHAIIHDASIDLVDICVPTPAHEGLVIEALAAGRHVLCEKPLALDSTSAARIAAAAALARGSFMPAMCMRFWPQWAWLKSAADDRRYGRVMSATFRRVASMPPGWFADGNVSGGALLDLHVHDTDFVCHLFGLPQAVFSRGYVKSSGRTDHIVTQYLYDTGPRVVTAEGSWCMADGFAFEMRYTVNFEHATADFDIKRTPALVLSSAGASEAIDMSGDGYLGEIAYFVDCIRQGRPPLRVTADDAVASLRVLEAEQRSIDTARIVAV